MTFDTEKYTKMVMMEDYQLLSSIIYYDILLTDDEICLILSFLESQLTTNTGF